jgi:hypothetical protein
MADKEEAIAYGIGLEMQLICVVLVPQQQRVWSLFIYIAMSRADRSSMGGI